eukprot:m.146758 g.146758  ORF g.146758 m.146758 type:complete len:680 (+) comp17264_c2_seq2:203-2242(+)
MPQTAWELEDLGDKQHQQASSGGDASPASGGKKATKKGKKASAGDDTPPKKRGWFRRSTKHTKPEPPAAATVVVPPPNASTPQARLTLRVHPGSGGADGGGGAAGSASASPNGGAPLQARPTKRMPPVNRRDSHLNPEQPERHAKAAERTLNDKIRPLVTAWCAEIGQQPFLVASRFLLKVSHNVIVHPKDKRYRQATTSSQVILDALHHPSCGPLMAKIKISEQNNTVTLYGPVELYATSSISLVAVRRSLNVLEAWEEFPEMVTREHKLGAGEFGEVYAGRWRGNKVAIKLLRDGADERSLQDFVREADIMRRFHHANVMVSLCVLLRTQPRQIVLPLMESNLLDMLRSDPLNTPQQVAYGLQLASGLAYIHSQEVVHCDLAARNVLINNAEQLKITDFGLARQAGSPECDTSKVVFPISVRWSAPEVFSTRILSKETDIWSWGVLLYEVLTAGVTPYLQFRNKQVSEQVASGFRLPQPAGCAKALHDVCLHCWSDHQSDRPTAAQLEETFEQLRKKHAAAARPRLQRKGAVRSKKGQQAFSEFLKRSGLVLDYEPGESTDDGGDLLFVDEASSIEDQPFYMGTSSKHNVMEATEPLLSRNGEFAVHTMTGTDHLIVSVLWQFPRHIVLAPGPSGQFHYGTATFPSAFALLANHINNKIPLLHDGCEVILLHPLQTC